MIIQIHKTWGIFEIETRIEFFRILWISDENYILQDNSKYQNRELKLVGNRYNTQKKAMYSMLNN